MTSTIVCSNYLQFPCLGLPTLDLILIQILNDLVSTDKHSWVSFYLSWLLCRTRLPELSLGSDPLCGCRRKDRTPGSNPAPVPRAVAGGHLGVLGWSGRPDITYKGIWSVLLGITGINETPGRLNPWIRLLLTLHLCLSIDLLYQVGSYSY